MYYHGLFRKNYSVVWFFFRALDKSQIMRYYLSENRIAQKYTVMCMPWMMKTVKASHSGIFVFAFVSAQIKIVCGIQNIFIDEGGIQMKNKHTERFRLGIISYECLCRNQRRSSTLSMEFSQGWSVSPQTHVFGNSENGSKSSAADGKSNECHDRRILP